MIFFLRTQWNIKLNPNANRREWIGPDRIRSDHKALITAPDRTQLNSTGCRNSELVQTDETDRKLDDLT